MGKVGKGEESVGGSGTGASFKELTGRKGARKGRGGVGGREGKEEGEAGACGERSSVVCLKNQVKAGGCSALDTLVCKVYTLHFTVHSRHFTH